MTIRLLELSPAVGRRLKLIAETDLSKRIIMNCLNAGASRDETVLVTAIAVVECSARPLDARLVEWLVALTLRSGLMGSRIQELGRSITVGPFQLREGPYRLSESTKKVLAEVRKCLQQGMTIRGIGAYWNGPQAESYHAASYANVLLDACNHVGARLDRLGVRASITD